MTQKDDAMTELADAALDRELSALVDGELDAARASALRARIASDPEIAARFDAFDTLRAQLADAPAREVPSDLAQRLALRIAAAEADAANHERDAEGAREDWLDPVGGAKSQAPGGTGVLSDTGRRLRVAVPSVLAVAAAVALYFVLASGPPVPGAAVVQPGAEARLASGADEAPGAEGAPAAVAEPARASEPGLAAPVEDPSSLAAIEPRLEPLTIDPEPVIERLELPAPRFDALAEVPELPVLPGEAREFAAFEPATSAGPEDAAVVLDDELELAAIALDIELLRDFDVIDQLELLELLVEVAEARDGAQRG